MTGRTRLLVILAAVLVGVTIGGALSIWLLPPADRSIAAPAIGGPFTLVDQEGRPRSDRDFRGHPVLVTFGFTHCPDVCPLLLQTMADAFAQLGPASSGVEGLFISVDPQRDTPQAMKDYIEAAGPRMVGLTGTPEQIAAVARAYRVYYRVNGDPTRDDYTVDHTALLYLMDRDGRFVAHFTHQTPPEAIAAAIRRVL